jgi:poly(ADP-ribose) glycohydrolase ARH3
MDRVDVAEDKFLGCMLGSALGDAIGEIAFRMPKEPELRAYIQRTDNLQYTDDTAMALGIAEAILAGQGEISQSRLGDIFRTSYDREPWRGYGPGPPRIFRMVEEEGIAYTEAARRLFGGEGSMGNGAAMRIAPVGIFYAGTGRTYDMAERTAAVTHRHPVGRDGAGVLARAVTRAALASPGEELAAHDWIADLGREAETKEFREAMDELGAVLQSGAGRHEAARRLGTDVLIHRSVPYAIWSFLAAPISFEECLMNAIMVRGDRDTIGTMACALSGAYLGVGAVPQQWKQRLENRARIRNLARELHELRARGAQG